MLLSIKIIKRLAAFLIFALLFHLAAAAAPESLAGYLGRRQRDVDPTRSIAESSIAFRADGTYQENWSLIRSTYSSVVPDRVGEILIPESGAYIYRKLSDTIAELTFLPAGGATTNKLNLHFTSEVSAAVEFPASSVGIGDQFNFVPPAGQSTLINISTRARVRAGESTIVGFIAARPSDFIIRVAGPALAAFNVQNLWDNPTFQIFDGSNELRPWLSILQDGRIVYPRAPHWDHSPGARETNGQAFVRAGAFAFAGW